MARRCNPSIAAPPRLPASSFRIDAGGSVPGKAATVPGGPPVIQVDRAFWARLTERDRAALIAHEVAHHEDPKACEPCTDQRAGARLRHEGWSASDVAAAFGRIVGGRPAARYALEGWKAADAVIRQRAAEVAGLANTAETIAPPRKTWRALDDVRYADGTTDLFRSRSDGGVESFDGVSEGVPDVDGTSAEDPAVLEDLLRRPPAGRPKPKPRPAAPAPAPSPSPSPSSSSSGILLLVAGAAVLAVVLLKR